MTAAQPAICLYRILYMYLFAYRLVEYIEMNDTLLGSGTNSTYYIALPKARLVENTITIFFFMIRINQVIRHVQLKTQLLSIFYHTNQ